VTAASSVDRLRLAWFVAGGIALVGGTLLGWNSALLDAIATPPALIRAFLVGAAVVAGLWLLSTAMRRMTEAGIGSGSELSGPGLATLVRGVRLVFLAVAAFAAAGGWLLGHPLPFIVALVIAGVDVLETSFLLLIVALRRDG